MSVLTRDSDTRRMAETRSGSGRSPSGGVVMIGDVPAFGLGGQGPGAYMTVADALVRRLRREFERELSDAREVAVRGDDRMVALLELVVEGDHDLAERIARRLYAGFADAILADERQRIDAEWRASRAEAERHA